MDIRTTYAVPVMQVVPGSWQADVLQFSYDLIVAFATAPHPEGAFARIDFVGVGGLLLQDGDVHSWEISDRFDRGAGGFCLTEHPGRGEFVDFLAGDRPNPDNYVDGEHPSDYLRHFSIHCDEVVSMNVASVSCFARYFEASNDLSPGQLLDVASKLGSPAAGDEWVSG